MPRTSHHCAKRRVAFKYALRVWWLLIWAVKNSSNTLGGLGRRREELRRLKRRGRGEDDVLVHVRHLKPPVSFARALRGDRRWCKRHRPPCGISPTARSKRSGFGSLVSQSSGTDAQPGVLVGNVRLARTPRSVRQLSLNFCRTLSNSWSRNS